MNILPYCQRGLRDTCSFFLRQILGVNVKKILLYGDRSYIDQLCSQIKQITGIETLLINPFDRVVNRKKAQGVDNASCYVLATGIATREVQS